MDKIRLSNRAPTKWPKETEQRDQQWSTKQQTYNIQCNVLIIKKQIVIYSRLKPTLNLHQVVITIFRHLYASDSIFFQQGTDIFQKIFGKIRWDDSLKIVDLIV